MLKNIPSELEQFGSQNEKNGKLDLLERSPVAISPKRAID